MASHNIERIFKNIKSATDTKCAHQLCFAVQCKHLYPSFSFKLSTLFSHPTLCHCLSFEYNILSLWDNPKLINYYIWFQVRMPQKYSFPLQLHHDPILTCCKLYTKYWGHLLPTLLHIKKYMQWKWWKWGGGGGNKEQIVRGPYWKPNYCNTGLSPPHSHISICTSLFLCSKMYWENISLGCLDGSVY